MTSPSSQPIRPTDHQTLTTLFDLGRQVTSVLDLETLVRSLPDLVRRLLPFDAFSIYLLDERRHDLRIAYSVGYPEGVAERVRLASDEGLVGQVVTERRPLLCNDLEHEPRYVAVVPGMSSTLVVPLVHKGRAIGALNILSAARDQYDEQDVAILSQFAVHVAVALANASLFERERRDAETFELLAEIGREMSSILEFDVLLEHIGHLVARVIPYRTFGVFLLDEDAGDLVAHLAWRFGMRIGDIPRIPLGEGLVGRAALERRPVLVPDVSRDDRYIKLVEDVRSELAVPMLIKDKCIGVFDLESPDVNAFDQRDVHVVTLLASQAAVAVENARLYEALRENEARMEKELRFAQRVQAALLPSELPKRMRGVDVAARFAPALELGGDFHDFLSAEANSLVIAVGDVSGKGVPAALYGAFAGELVRSRTFQRRYRPAFASPANVLASINTILRQRDLDAYCTLGYAAFDLKRRTVTFANSGLPYPLRVSRGDCETVELPGVPLGTFDDIAYDEVSFALEVGDVFVFCTDGVFEATSPQGEEFGRDRLVEVIRASSHLPARAIADAVFEAVERHESDAPQLDDMTVVVVRIVH